MTVNVSESPIAIVVVDLLSAMAVTGIGAAGAFTVTEQVPDLVLSKFEVAVMVAVPCATAVTKPLSLTVATPGLLLVHVTLLSAEAGVASTVAVNCFVSLGSNVAEEGLMVTLETVGVTGVLLSPTMSWVK